jgi:hypothetical protein
MSEEELGLEISAHARRRKILRNVSGRQVNAILVLCPLPIDQGDGTHFYRAFVDNRNPGVVRALYGVIVTVLDFDAPTDSLRRMKPLRVEYDPAVYALAIDFPGFGAGASVRMVRLDRDRALDYDADGRLVSIELLNVSRGIDLTDLPETEVITRALDLLAVGRSAA